MILGIVMMILGLILVLLEFFVPGGVIGAGGAILLIFGLVIFATGSPSILLTIVVVVVLLVALGCLVKFALWRIRHTKQESSIYLKTDQEGYRASEFGEELVGKEGTIVSPLRPSGNIVIEGKRIQAVSLEGYLDKGTKVVVVAGEGAHLIVRKKKE